MLRPIEAGYYLDGLRVRSTPAHSDAYVVVRRRVQFDNLITVCFSSIDTNLFHTCTYGQRVLCCLGLLMPYALDWNSDTAGIIQREREKKTRADSDLLGEE